MFFILFSRELHMRHMHIKLYFRINPISRLEIMFFLERDTDGCNTAVGSLLQTKRHNMEFRDSTTWNFSASCIIETQWLILTNRFIQRPPSGWKFGSNLNGKMDNRLEILLSMYITWYTNWIKLLTCNHVRSLWQAAAKAAFNNQHQLWILQ